MKVNSVSINCAGKSCPQFKGRELVSETKYPDYIEKRYNVDASKGKKWGVGIASFAMSGLGQFINGDIWKGVGFFSVSTLAFAGRRYAQKKNCFPALVASGILAAATKVISIVDAVKHAKSEAVEIVPKK